MNMVQLLMSRQHGDVAATYKMQKMAESRMDLQRRILLTWYLKARRRTVAFEAQSSGIVLRARRS